MTTHTQVKPLAQSKYQLVFQPSALATKYCKGKGIEIGAAAHNPFYLEGCLNVSDQEGFEFYKGAQVEMCGSYADADLFADGASLPLEDDSQDYVVSSHMAEHHPDPIGLFIEWVRVTKNGGIIYTIVPKRDAHPLDVDRPVSKVEDMVAAWVDHATVETAEPAVNGGKGGHYWVFDTALISDLVLEINERLKFATVEFVERRETDDKVGNGILFILRVVKHPHSVMLGGADAIEEHEQSLGTVITEEEAAALPPAVLEEVPAPKRRKKSAP